MMRESLAWSLARSLFWLSSVRFWFSNAQISAHIAINKADAHEAPAPQISLAASTVTMDIDFMAKYRTDFGRPQVEFSTVNSPLEKSKGLCGYLFSISPRYPPATHFQSPGNPKSVTHPFSLLQIYSFSLSANTESETLRGLRFCMKLLSL